MPKVVKEEVRAPSVYMCLLALAMQDGNVDAGSQGSADIAHPVLAPESPLESDAERMVDDPYGSDVAMATEGLSLCKARHVEQEEQKPLCQSWEEVLVADSYSPAMLPAEPQVDDQDLKRRKKSEDNSVRHALMKAPTDVKKTALKMWNSVKDKADGDEAKAKIMQEIMWGAKSKEWDSQSFSMTAAVEEQTREGNRASFG